MKTEHKPIPLEVEGITQNDTSIILKLKTSALDPVTGMSWPVAGTVIAHPKTGNRLVVIAKPTQDVLFLERQKIVMLLPEEEFVIIGHISE